MPAPCRVMLMSRELQAGGSERQLAGIAMALDRSRFEPHVCCFHDNGFRAEELRAAGVPILRLPVRSFLSASAAKGALRLKRYLDAQRIQLVHTWDYPMNAYGVPLARAFGVPVVLSSQRSHRGLVPGPLRHFVRATQPLVDAIVVNSASVRRHLIEEERVPAGLIRICYNGIDTRAFCPAPRLPRPPALETASLVIGVICVLRPEKGLPVLLEAFARVRHVRPRAKLLFVGSGEMLPDLQTQAARLNIDGDCVFEPATRDVARWLRAIDIFVLPSLSEAFSNSLMEAMACGCCAVASDVGGNPELIKPGETGLLFRRADPADLAEKLHLLMSDDCLRPQLAATAARFIHENFSWDASARCMGGIYESLLAGRLSR